MIKDLSTANFQPQCTPAFKAPELLTTGNMASPMKADIWAAGVCLFCFVFGQLPFQGDSIVDVYAAIREQPLTFPQNLVVSNELQDLLYRLLDKVRAC